MASQIYIPAHALAINSTLVAEVFPMIFGLSVARRSTGIAINASEGKAIGNETVSVVVPATMSLFPPWVQVGNDADPDERHGSFTENRQN